MVDPPTATGWEFEFTIAPSEGLSPDTPQTVTPADPTITWGNLVDGVEYTITETDDPSDGFIHGAIVCGDGEGAYNTFTAVAGETVTCTATNTELNALDVATTATASFNRLVAWSLDKSVTPASHAGTAGANAGSSTWTVVATKTETLGGFAVTGNVTIANSNAIPVLFAITQSLDDGTPVNLTCPSLTVPANGNIVCSFTATPSAATATVATAVVTPSIARLGVVTRTAVVSFLATVIGADTVTVDDDRDTEGQFPAVISSSTTFDYGDAFPCSANPADYTNFVDNDQRIRTRRR